MFVYGSRCLCVYIVNIKSNAKNKSKCVRVYVCRMFEMHADFAACFMYINSYCGGGRESQLELPQPTCCYPTLLLRPLVLKHTLRV